MTAKIIINDLHKSFGQKKVLQGVTVSVEKGESLVVIGGSGSGKSVLLKNIIGLMKPEKGSVQIDGEETVDFSAKEHDRIMHKFGYLFQGGALFDSLKIWENIAFGLIQGRGMNRKDAKEIALEKLNSVGLGKDVGELYPAELSGGMQKRVSLARAVAANPEIIFFDEPTTGLDPIMADVINDLIVKCSEELGATTITITHDMASVRKVADQVAMIYEGRIIWHGPIDAIDDSGNPYVDQFIHGRAEGPIEIKLQDH
ncbi:MAG: ATP-binding cassette domain-containing protein [Hyphomicrobiales bacterium]|nr:ATP-binding cassette domain-containing protein [Rickettsiales bacterium]MCP5361499.1 ATP-binding cassette domain-containing protein [Hyphomicrobiales bacterium]